MFQSATLKLTGWYMLILIIISVLFSGVIYTITSNEVGTRLERLQIGLQTMPGMETPRFSNTLRSQETRDAAANLLYELVYANVAIIILGGIGSYLLARRTLQPIEAAHAAQSRFTSDASHELRTPLAAMKTEIEVTLRNRDSTPAELRETLASNLDEVEKLSRLSEMLLKLSRLDHDKLQRGPVNLSEIVNRVIAHTRQPDKRIHATIRRHFIVLGNEPAITDLITILVDNALKYSPADSQITLSLSTKNRSACFKISNKGSGIAEDKLPHIFERFYRADTSRTNEMKKSYGLGLGIAKDIVELHDGELFVTSGVNRPTVFTVLLPIFRLNQAKTQM